MTDPHVPLRLELEFEVPGTAEQVWQAIATANGISSWYLPTELEERLGGAVRFHMGDTSSTGEVTDWDPPRRLEYAEPGWADFTGHPDGNVTPMVTEFLVEARSGGTCVVRVVTSAFGSGDDWEQEIFDSMEQGWPPFFGHLTHYLTHFPGQQVTPLHVMFEVGGKPDPVRAALRRSVGVERVGQEVELRGLRGVVIRDDDTELLVDLGPPIPGLLGLFVFVPGEEAFVQVAGHLFSEDAAAYVEREIGGWEAWVKSLASPAVAESGSAP
jgi:uncharacterized protein YndB with AHSA1/START domain